MRLSWMPVVKQGIGLQKHPIKLKICAQESGLIHEFS
jgi:hypothetical protein